MGDLAIASGASERAETKGEGAELGVAVMISG